MQSKPHKEELNREREKEKRRNDKGTNVTTPVHLSTIIPTESPASGLLSLREVSEEIHKLDY